MIAPVVVIVTRTVVDHADPAFDAPTKFVGARYTEQEARRLAAEHGWTVAPDTAGRRLVVLTDVDGVRQDFGTPRERLLSTVDVEELRTMDFPAGSMGPKVEGCLRFVTATGRPAAIGALRDAPAVLDGTAGTTITT